MNDKVKRFMEFSSLVGNENEIIEKETLNEISADEYEFIELKIINRLSKTPQIDKKGINRALVEAVLGIAETGSVLLSEPSENHRRATALCERLEVVLPASRIVDSLEEASEKLKELTSTENGTYAVFVTGASRTADIEMSLTLGVHGPQEMKVFIVKDA